MTHDTTRRELMRVRAEMRRLRDAAIEVTATVDALISTLDADAPHSALAVAGTLVERTEAWAARGDRQDLADLAADVAAAVGLTEVGTAARWAARTLASALIERAEEKATADRDEAAAESADDVRDWEGSR